MNFSNAVVKEKMSLVSQFSRKSFFFGRFTYVTNGRVKKGGSDLGLNSEFRFNDYERY